MIGSNELADALLLLWQQKQCDMETLADEAAEALCRLSEEQLTDHSSSDIWTEEPQNKDQLVTSFIQKHQKI